MPITLNGDTGITTPTYGGAVAAEYIAPVTSFKNRIINGAMMIDQRNAGASVTINVNTDVYTVDRFLAAGQSADGVFTVQQSTTAPSGFTNSLKATVTTADSSLGATQYYFLAQKIEGLNVADLGWGTASAATVTLSFQVYSSVTGTFGGALTNGAFDRGYPFTYTISSANTWTTVSVTIAGDTSGTWLKTNGIGLRIYFGLGIGSTYSGTAGAWGAAGYISATGATNLMATNGATFYLTGVQLEKGSNATSFDYRPYGTELALCQRYFALGGAGMAGWYTSSTNVQGGLTFPVEMRSAPTATFLGGSILMFSPGVGAFNATALPNQDSSSTRGVVFSLTTSGATSLRFMTTPNNLVSLSSEL